MGSDPKEEDPATVVLLRGRIRAVVVRERLWLSGMILSGILGKKS